MRTAIAYIRVSTEDQAREGVSLGAQEAKINAWALTNDYEVAAVHRDAGLSGGRADNRPALQRALKEAKEGTALVVYSLSRLARSTRDAISISEALEKAGADLVSLTERIDTTTAAGKMMFRLMSVLAEFERDQIAERTKMAMRHLRHQGIRVGHAPFGWRLGRDKRSLVAHEKEQWLIRLMQNQRSRGATYEKIAKGLEADGFRTKCGRRHWHPKVVWGILKAVRINEATLAVSR
jgi:site-specific DNA recombinase